jgi:hypothetical protein
MHGISGPGEGRVLGCGIASGVRSLKTAKKT